MELLIIIILLIALLVLLYLNYFNPKNKRSKNQFVVRPGKDILKMTVYWKSEEKNINPVVMNEENKESESKIYLDATTYPCPCDGDENRMCSNLSVGERNPQGGGPGTFISYLKKVDKIVYTTEAIRENAQENK